MAQITILPEYKDKIKWHEYSPGAASTCSLCELIIKRPPIILYDINKNWLAVFHCRCFATAIGKLGLSRQAKGQR